MCACCVCTWLSHSFPSGAQPCKSFFKNLHRLKTRAQKLQTARIQQGIKPGKWLQCYWNWNAIEKTAAMLKCHEETHSFCQKMTTTCQKHTIIAANIVSITCKLFCCATNSSHKVIEKSLEEVSINAMHRRAGDICEPSRDWRMFTPLFIRHSN